MIKLIAKKDMVSKEYLIEVLKDNVVVFEIEAENRYKAKLKIEEAKRNLINAGYKVAG